MCGHGNEQSEWTGCVLALCYLGVVALAVSAWMGMGVREWLDALGEMFVAIEQ